MTEPPQTANTGSRSGSAGAPAANRYRVRVPPAHRRTSTRCRCWRTFWRVDAAARFYENIVRQKQLATSAIAFSGRVTRAGAVPIIATPVPSASLDRSRERRSTSSSSASSPVRSATLSSRRRGARRGEPGRHHGQHARPAPYLSQDAMFYGEPDWSSRRRSHRQGHGGRRPARGNAISDARQCTVVITIPQSANGGR